MQVIHDSEQTSTEQNYQRTSIIRSVAIFGYADTKPGEPLYEDTFELAKYLAQKGLVIVNGGGPGVMDAATRGAESVGGKTLVVTFYPEDAPGFEGRYLENTADKEIVTENYISRMFKLMENADAFVICNGGTGTISELGTAWVMARLYFGRHKPFVLYGNFWYEIMDVITKNMMMRGNEGDVYRISESPEQVWQNILEFDREMMTRGKVSEGKGDEHDGQ